MQTTIVKWGNSQGIRLPKQLLDSVNFSDYDTVDVKAEGNAIIIKKIESKRVHKTLKERLSGFDGEYVFEEWDTGEPVGEEVL